MQCVPYILEPSLKAPCQVVPCSLSLSAQAEKSVRRPLRCRAGRAGRGSSARSSLALAFFAALSFPQCYSWRFLLPQNQTHAAPMPEDTKHSVRHLIETKVPSWTCNPMPCSLRSPFPLRRRRRRRRGLSSPTSPSLTCCDVSPRGWLGKGRFATTQDISLFEVRKQNLNNRNPST